jgi:hypothetical protein
VQSKGLDWIMRYIHDDLKVLRIIAPRSHAEDKNPLALPKRGYDDQGNPLCLYGYRLSFNGHDYQRRDGKWVCRYHPSLTLPSTSPSPMETSVWLETLGGLPLVEAARRPPELRRGSQCLPGPARCETLPMVRPGQQCQGIHHRLDSTYLTPPPP